MTPDLATKLIDALHGVDSVAKILGCTPTMVRVYRRKGLPAHRIDQIKLKRPLVWRQFRKENALTEKLVKVTA